MTTWYDPWLCSVVGAIMLWARWSVGPGRRRLSTVIPFADFFAKVKLDWRLAYILEFVIFVGMGAFIAVKVLGFAGCKEAFSAGLGWTGLFSQVHTVRRASA